MQNLSGKQVVLGVCGSIAAYKAPDLVRRLRDRGADVRVVLSGSADTFVAPLSLQAVSGHPVRQALFDPGEENAMGHIELARWADLVLVAPASAGFMARLAQGFADDLLSTLCLATESPLVLAPAMNRVMWQNRATQANRALLAERGVRLLGPGLGPQACGETGEGRMLEPGDLADLLVGQNPPRLLEGVRALVTAGPTREPIDPVRFVGNRSSGKMGYALAEAMAAAGAEVELVSGPVNLQAPPHVARAGVETALQMEAEVMARIGAVDIFVSAAAVADYRPAEVASAKIKKQSASFDLRLERNPDILARVAGLDAAPFTVGFAAETGQLEQHAENKLRNKKLDMIAANRVADGPGGFDSDDNQLTVLWRGGRKVFPLMTKKRLAVLLTELIAERYNEKNPTEST